MSQAGWATALFAAAVLVPGAALELAADPGRAVPSPFGWEPLLVAHLLAALPAAGVGGWLVVRQTGGVNPWLAGAAGVGLAVLAYALGPAVGDLLDGAGLETRVVVRSAWCALLELPWAVAAVAVGWPDGGTRPARTVLAAAALAAVVPPGLYADRLATEKAAELQDQVSRLRVAKARETAAGLADLDPDRPIEVAGKSVPLGKLRKDLDAWGKHLADGVARPLLPTASPPVRFEYARALLLLGELDRAEAGFRELAPIDASSRLLLGEVLHEQGRWADGDGAIRSGLDELLPRAGADPGVAGLCRMAYDALARSARERRAATEAEAVYREGLERLPGSRAYFHVQLGRQYQATGRPAAALAQFEEARRLDPAAGRQAEAFEKAIREATPGCLVGR